jgi:hypothetical protein
VLRQQGLQGGMAQAHYLAGAQSGIEQPADQLEPPDLLGVI